VNRPQLACRASGTMSWPSGPHPLDRGGSVSLPGRRSAGFDNVSLDLIFGLPGQTVDRWLESLDEAIAWARDLSIYP